MVSIRFGMVGAGFWATDVHLPILSKHAGVELVGVWDRNPAKADTVAARFGARGFPRYEAMLDAVDAVSIAVPPGVQPDFAIPAARAGKHLMLEKPIAFRSDVARTVVAEVETAGVAAVVFFTRRYIPEIVAAMPGLLADGPWTAGRACFHTGAMVSDTPYATSSWRQQKGVLWDLGPHAVSVLLPVLGPVREACAVSFASGVIEFQLRHESGARSTASLTFHAAPADRAEVYEFSGGGRTRRVGVAPASRQPCFVAALDSLLEAVVRPGMEAPACSVQFGSEVVRILSEAEQSLARAN